MSILGMTTLAEIEPSRDIFAGLHPNLEETDIVIASGQNLVRGTCLGLNTATGKYHKWNQSATDGTEVLKGILGCDVDATNADDKGFMYVHGEFNIEALVATEAITAGTYNYGTIVIRKENA